MMPIPARFFLPALLLTGASLSLLGAVGLGVAGSAASAQPPGPPPGTFCLNPYSFPARGFDYPQPQRTVEGWVAARDEMRAREHGWYLFAGLNKEIGGMPIWRTWCTATETFAPPGTAVAPPRHHGSLKERREPRGLTTPATPTAPLAAPSGSAADEDSIEFSDGPVYPVPKAVYSNPAYKAAKCTDGTSTTPLGNGPTLFNETNVMITGVIYNDPANDWVRSRNLYQASALNAYLAKGDRVMPVMPSSSFVLKPMWWPVQQGDAYTALPVWDDLPPSADEDRYAGFERQQLWSRAVAITAKPKPGVKVHEARYLYGVEDARKKPLKPRVYRGAGVVGVDQFYHWQPKLATMAPCDRALLDQSAYWAYNREFRQGDYLVLMAMHVMTREQPDWTFQSFWWHDKPDYGPFASGRPNIPAAQAPGPWRHYLMASTYGMLERPDGKSWPIAYNPYIELAADHPIRTNCMNCHHRAAWAKASYEAPGGPDALQAYTYNNAIFNGVMRTDSMWTVASVQPNPTSAAAAPAGGAVRARR